jgi:hypothetical protein
VQASLHPHVGFGEYGLEFIGDHHCGKELTSGGAYLLRDS